ncbi:MAG: hypothetical protein RIB43_09700 [Rhodospirillaceae bacterium]
MPDKLHDLIVKWTLKSESGPLIQEASDLIKSLEDRLYEQYEPTSGPNPPFWIRLEEFVNNTDDDEDRQILFRLITQVIFVGNKEFDSLHRTAFTSNISRWLVDMRGINLFEENSLQQLDDAVGKTWFCSITDSMKIGSFHRINGINNRGNNIEFRPHADIVKDPAPLEKYLVDNSKEYLVLLEDFVGSGNQMKSAIKLAQSLKGGKLPVLICPLLVCPNGYEFGKRFQSKHENVTFDPVFRLDEATFIPKDSPAEESEILQKIRSLLEKLHPLVCGTGEQEAKYGPFGYEDTGSLTVMYTNCPNNTVPAVHYKSNSWAPVFPRQEREEFK